MDNKDIGPQIKLQLDQMITSLSSMKITSPLIWLWVWDTIVEKYNQYEVIDNYNDFIVAPDITLDIIFEKLYANPPADFTLEYGVDQMDEAITDWMIDQEFLVALEDDEWLNEDEDIVDLTAEEENEMSNGLVAEDIT